MRFALFARSRAGALLLVLDALALVAIFDIAHRFHIGSPIDLTSIQLYAAVALTCLTLYMLDVYRVDYNFPSVAFPIQGVTAVVVAGLLLAAIIYVLPEETHAGSRSTIYWRGVLVVAMASFAVWVALSRFVVSAWYNRLATAQQWLIIGEPEVTADARHDFSRIRLGEQLVEMPVSSLECADGAGADDIIMSRKWAGVVIANRDDLSAAAVNRLMAARLAGVRIYDIFDFYETFLLKVPVRFVHDQWLLLSHGFDLVHHNVQLRFKQVADLVIAFLLLVVTSPVMLLVALAVVVDSRGGIIYAQERVGLNGRIFRIFKFRTMVPDAEKDGARWAEAHDERITRVGRFLRPSRLDELPQLWNVLRGDMSFIGPRPERPDFVQELEEQIPYFNLRVLVKPGITGWAQVQYPYGASVDDARQKLEYDLFYIKNYSILLDLAILFKTVRVVLFRSGR